MQYYFFKIQVTLDLMILLLLVQIIPEILLWFRQIGLSQRQSTLSIASDKAFF